VSSRVPSRSKRTNEAGAIVAAAGPSLSSSPAIATTACETKQLTNWVFSHTGAIRTKAASDESCTCIESSTPEWCFELNFSVSSCRRNQGTWNWKWNWRNWSQLRVLNSKENSKSLSFELLWRHTLYSKEWWCIYLFCFASKEWWDVGSFRTVTVYFSFFPFLTFPTIMRRNGMIVSFYCFLFQNCRFECLRYRK